MTATKAQPARYTRLAAPIAVVDEPECPARAGGATPSSRPRDCGGARRNRRLPVDSKGTAPFKEPNEGQDRP